MANHQYIQVMDIEELKRACPNINFDNCQFLMGDSPVIQLNSQEQIVINDGRIIYEQPQHSQMAPQQYIIQEEDIQGDGSFASQAGQIFFATDSMIDQQHQQINEVQQNLQTALIEPSQRIQTDTVQQQVVMHYQPASQSQQQIIVDTSASNVQQSTQTPQHHVIVQQNITPPHQQNMNQIHQSQPIVITPPQQNVVRQPYTVYSQTQHKRIIHQAAPQQNIQMRAVSMVEHQQQQQQQHQQQQQQQRILQQMSQPLQKAVPRLKPPSHVSPVQSNVMSRVRATRPRLPSVNQQTPRGIVQPSVRQPRQLTPGIIVRPNMNQNVQQSPRIVQNIRPQQVQYRLQGQQQPRFPAPVLQRIGAGSVRMSAPSSIATSIVPVKKSPTIQQKPPQNQNLAKPQYVTETNAANSSADLNELDDLENSITAAKIHKTPPERPTQNSPAQHVGTTPYIAQPQQSTSNLSVCQNADFANQRLLNNQNSQQVQQTYLHNPSIDDSRKVVTLRNGESMPLLEYKRKIQENQFEIQPQQQPQQQLQNLQNQQQPVGINPIRGNCTRGRGSIRGTGHTRGSYVKKAYRQQSHQQVQQQQQQQNPQPSQPPDQSQHIIESEARESAKMLVVLQSGEQRLITFTLPKESCTVQELLEQVGVPFTSHTNIECVTNPGVSIDYLVTVGVTCSGTPSEIISAAENTLQLKQQQSLQQQQLHQQQIQQQQLQQQQQHLQQQQQLQQMQQQQQQQLQKTTPMVVPKIDTPPQTILVKPKFPERVKSPPPKIVPGFLAVCPNCGLCSIDHHRCIRCRVVFEENVKIIASAGSDQPSVTKPKPIPSLITTEKRKKDIELVQKKHQISVAEIKNTIGGRGRGIGTISGRGRGRAKAKPEEPVILTLISDDEDDQSKAEKTASGKEVSPMHFEPKAEELNITLQGFVRKKITDTQKVVDKINTAIAVKSIRIGSYKFEPKEKVTFSSIGMRIIAPSTKHADDNIILDIQKDEIVKIVCHLSTPLCILFIYAIRTCGSYVRDSLEMSLGTQGFYYDPNSQEEPHKKIIIQMDSIAEEAKSTIKSIFPVGKIDEISYRDAISLLEMSNRNQPMVKSDANASSSNDIRQILIYPPPPTPQGITINTEDYQCLAVDQYLNDVIIDFYLKYLREEVLTNGQRDRTHIFSTFFYKRLTRLQTPRQRQAEKDVKLTASQRRHARVKTWTKNVNVFEKDFIIIPINEQHHWFLAIICYPGLTSPVTFDSLMPVKQIKCEKRRSSGRKTVPLQIGNTTITPVSKRDQQEYICLGDESEKDEAEGDDSDVASEDSDIEVDPSTQPIKQPCILIFDSLAGTSRNRVVATLRDYLTCEYRAKLGDGNSSRVFNKDNIPNYSVKVPQQNNFTDCGLYLLQYVEQFFAAPVKDFRLAVMNKQLSNWFDGMLVTRKREDLTNLLKKLVHQYSPENMPLPEIELPTLNGELIEQEQFNENDEMGEFEEEELEDEEFEDGGVSTEIESSPEKVNNSADNKTSNGTKQIVFKRTHDDRAEPIPRKNPKFDKFDELKNSN